MSRRLEGLRKNTKHFRHDTLPPSRGLAPERPECEAQCSSLCRNVPPPGAAMCACPPRTPAAFSSACRSQNQWPAAQTSGLRFGRVLLCAGCLRTDVTPETIHKMCDCSLQLAVLLLLCSGSDNCVLPHYACRLSGS